MSYLNGPGSRLFNMSSFHPGLLIYSDPEFGEPVDPPRFLIADLPDDLRQKFIELNEAWPNLEDPIVALVEAGVDELEWRQPLRHVEFLLYSEDVFGALQELLPHDIRSVVSINIAHGRTRRRYHKIDRTACWPVRNGDLVATRAESLVVRELCRPPLDPDSSIHQAISRSEDDLELALPSWMDRDDRILNLNIEATVTEGLMNRWRATPISTHLRETNYEHDLWFTESAGGYKKGGRPAAFRWVDAPMPDWVDNP